MDPDTILLAKTMRSDAIKNLIECLSGILQDCNFIFDASGLKIFAMDETGATLVSVVLHGEKFDCYACTKPLTLGLNISCLHKLLKSIEKDDILSFIVENDKEDILCIRLDNASKKATVTYKLKLLDLDQSTESIPTVDFASIIKMPSSEFQRMCRNMSVLSSTLDIKSSGNNIILTCHGDFADCDIVIGGGENISGITVDNVDSTEIVEGKFLLKRLLAFSKASSLHSSMQIMMKNDFPLIVVYSVADLGKLHFCLAPISDGLI